MPMTTLDPRTILTGSDGELWDLEGNFLAQINTFEAQIAIKNIDYRPAGLIQDVAVLDGYSVTLTFQETVIKDAVFLEKVVNALKEKKQFYTNFKGVLRGKDGSTSTVIFRSCTPDGTIDLMNVKPGDILNRAWTWRVNEAPDLQSVLGA